MLRKKGKYSDAELIEGIKAGGLRRQRMTQTFFDTHRGLVIKGVRQFRITEEAAADIYTDSIINLMRQVENDHFKGDSTLFTYLFTIFKNKCLNYLRDQKPQPINWKEEFLALPDYAQNALDQLINKESLDNLYGFLKKLGDKCRQILWDTLYYGYNADEVAERMGYKDSNSVYITKHRCLKKLEQLISIKE